MATLKVDTTKMRECGKDIVEAADTYNTNVRNLFTRMSEVPSKTKEWEGIADVNFGNGLIALGKTLIQYADDLEKAIKNNKIK